MLRNILQASMKKTNDLLALHFLTGLRVLFVDASGLNHKQIEHLLQSWQVEVAYASSGRQAIEKLNCCAASLFYHAILVDIQISQKDGYEAIQLLQKHTNIPILALSDAPIDAKELNINEIIVQPFEPETLHKKLKEHTAYEWFVVSKRRPYKVLADFEAVDEFADGDLAYRTEMFDLYKKFFVEFLASYKESVENQDLKMLKALTHKARPSVRLMNLSTIEDELNRVAKILEENITEESLNAQISTTSIERYCLLCLAHLHIFSPEINEN